MAFRRTTALQLALAVLGGGWCAVAARAQTPRDASAWIRTARDAQRAFEGVRRNHLRWTWGGADGRCDERIGRYCYWHGETPDTAPPESPVTVRARRTLLAVLDSAARALPGDDWIAGQRVRYELEAGVPDSALAAVTPCAATGWWCDALRGLALHAAGRYAQANDAFDAALAAMPDSTRCLWLDVTPLLHGRLADRYRHVGCDQRPAFDERLWWLAWPFYMTPGNDRRSEHFARRTIIRIASRSVWPETPNWGDDLAELILRYGWPRWFERVRPQNQSDPMYAIMGHDPQPSFAFFPDVRLLDSAYDARPDDWDLHPYRAASRYAPRYATAIVRLNTMISRFERGDSMVVVAAYDASGDSLFRSGPLRAGLTVTPDPRQRFTAIDSNATPSGTAAVTAPAQDAIVSVELFDDSTHAAGRYREGLHNHRRDNAIRISDLLPFRPGDSLPASLSQAVPLAIVTPDPSPRAPLGLYWEVYGPLNSGTPMHVQLSVQRTGASWWQRAWWALHLGGRDAPIVLHWNQAARPEFGLVPEAVTLDLSRLDGGTYRIRLSVDTPDAGSAVVDRHVTIRR